MKKQPKKKRMTIKAKRKKKKIMRSGFVRKKAHAGARTKRRQARRDQGKKD